MAACCWQRRIAVPLSRSCRVLHSRVVTLLLVCCCCCCCCCCGLVSIRWSPLRCSPTALRQALWACTCTAMIRPASSSCLQTPAQQPLQQLQACTYRCAGWVQSMLATVRSGAVFCLPAVSLVASPLLAVLHDNGLHKALQEELWCRLYMACATCIVHQGCDHLTALVCCFATAGEW
jgi:hypothetical protein